MWPSFTVRLMQDTDKWQIFLQALSSIAIIFAAVVAAVITARYANKKDRDELRTKRKYLLSLLELLESYLVVFSDSIRTDDWLKAKGYFHIITDNSADIIDTLEKGLLSFAACTTYDTLSKIHYLIFYFHESEKEVVSYLLIDWESKRAGYAESWKTVIESVHIAIELHKRNCRPIIIRGISLALFRAKLRREKRGRNSQKGSDIYNQGGNT